MKRNLFNVLLVIMALVAIFTLCACGKNNGNTENGADGEASCHHEWKFLNGTQPACAPNGFSIYQCETCGQTKEIASVECEFKNEFTLSGDSCTDGFTVKSTCIYCSKTSYTEFSDHTLFKMYSYKMCKGDAVVSACPCGEKNELSLPGACTGWVNNSVENKLDEETGIMHELSHSFCTICQFEIKTDVYEEEIGCLIFVREKGQIVDGETVFFEYFDAQADLIECHDIKTSFSDLLGNSCFDGYTVTEKCAACSYEASYQENTHDRVFLKTETDLKDFGACDGFIRVYGCACGEKTSRIEKHIGCENVKKSTEIASEGGINKVLDVYTCDTCKLVLLIETSELDTSCTTKYIVEIDGEVKYQVGYVYTK